MRRYITRHIWNHCLYGYDIEAISLDDAKALSLEVNGPEYEVCEVVAEVAVPEMAEVILVTEFLLCLN